MDPILASIESGVPEVDGSLNLCASLPESPSIGPCKEISSPMPAHDPDLLDEAVQPTKRDSVFYFNDVKLLVEETVVTIPHHYLRSQSDVFEDVLQSDQCFSLEGVTLNQRKDLLLLILPDSLQDFFDLDPEKVNTPPKPQFVEISSPSSESQSARLEEHFKSIDWNFPLFRMPISQWRSLAFVYELSTMWHMHRVAKAAIKRLIKLETTQGEKFGLLRWSTEWAAIEVRQHVITQLDNTLHGIDWIKLGTQCLVSDWVVRGFRWMIEQDSITQQEENLLGRPTVKKIFRLRHRRYLHEFDRDSRSLERTLRQELAASIELATYDFHRVSAQPPRSVIPQIKKLYMASVKHSSELSSIIFLIEGTLFRVPRWAFAQQSEVFEGMFTLPGTGEEGMNDSHPLCLPAHGISKAEFRVLLKFLFEPPAYVSNSTFAIRIPESFSLISEMSSGEDVSWKGWLGVLNLSRMWEMPSMADTAVSAVSTLPSSPEEWMEILRLATKHGAEVVFEMAKERLKDKVKAVERVMLAIECGIPEWRIKGLVEIVERVDDISDFDEHRLGSETTDKLFRMRDQIFRDQYQGSYDYPDKIEEMVRTEFVEAPPKLIESNKKKKGRKGRQ